MPDFTTLKPVGTTSGMPDFATLKPVTQTPVSKPGFIQNIQEGTKAIGKDILGIEQNKSTAFIPSLIRSTIGSQGLAGIAQLPGRVIDQAIHGKDEYNSLTPGQALGTTINAGLTAATGGSSGLATGLLGRTVENAAIGAGFQAGQNLSDKKPITQGLGFAAALGGAIPVAGTLLSKGKQAILGQATPTAEHAINSLIKPLGKDFAYGKNPARGILNEGIVANTFEDLSQKVSQKISSVGSEIGTLGQKLDQSGQISLNLTPALTPIDEAIQKAAKSNNTSLFNSLQNVKVALLHDLQVGVDEKGAPAIVQGEAKNLLTAGYNEAKQFLSDIAEHTRFTGNPSDDKALNMATKQAYGITREIMNKGAGNVSPEAEATMRNLNSRYGDLLSAKNAINHRDIVLKRQNFLNLADKFAIPVSIGGALMTGLATGDWAKAGAVLASELGGIAVTKGLGSTASITRVAQFLSKLAPEERVGILNSTPILKNVWERITGQTTPEAGAPKTKTLQSVEDWIKNPKLGMSIEDVSKIPEGDKNSLINIIDDIRSGGKQGKPPSMAQEKLLADYNINSNQSANKVANDIENLIGKKSSILKELQPLAKEAQKYKSAEEFVKAQGETVFRGGSKSFDKTLIGEDGVFVSPSKFMAETFGKNVDELVISPKAKILSYDDLPASIKAIDNWDEYSKAVSKYGREKGVDVIDSLPPKADFPRGMERTVLNPEVIQTKSQLTDFYNKVKKK